MNTRSLTHVGLSLIGVYALVQALVEFPALATWGSALMEFQQGRAVISLVTVAPFAVLVIVGCLLVTQPATIARWLTPPEESTEALQVSTGVAKLLFALVGILIFASAVPDLVRTLLSYAAASGRAPMVQLLVGQLARALFGLFLFFRPGVVLDFWNNTQGRRAPSIPDSPDL